MAGLFWEVALDRLADLAELGLVELDSRIRVPEPLIRSVAEALQDQFGVDVEYPASFGVPPPTRSGGLPVAGPLPSAPQSGPPGTEVLTGKRAAAPSSAYQLKIHLRNSKPPVWRRVVVPSGLRLDELHELIQVLFGWWDDHLHAFQSGGRGGQVCGRADPHTGALADDDADEATVSIWQVMTTEGEKIEYTYDFGDDWEHIVTLEKILPLGLAGPTGGLPRCTGGRGAAPQEDSGGVGGWTEMMQAANDPQHAEHETIREWLGLGPGERADAQAFSTQDANDAISVLRAPE